MTSAQGNHGKRAAGVPSGVYLVGAGPGDPRLLTLWARDVLARADVVLYDRLIHPTVLDWVPPTALTVYVGKSSEEDGSSQRAIEARLLAEARRGRVVVRLKGGDPLVFGRGGEELLALTEAGIPVTVVPGISSVMGAPAAAGIPLTHRGISSRFTVLSGHAPEDWNPVPPPGGTLVVLMGARRLGTVVQKLTEAGWSLRTPVAAIAWGTWGDQSVVRSRLETIAGHVPVVSPMLLVVGEVCAHPFPTLPASGPWAGRRIVGVAVDDELDELMMLREQGAEVVLVRLERDIVNGEADWAGLWRDIEDPAAVLGVADQRAWRALRAARSAAGRDLRTIRAALVAATPNVARTLMADGLVPVDDRAPTVCIHGREDGESVPPGWSRAVPYPLWRGTPRAIDPLTRDQAFCRPAWLRLFSSGRAVALLAERLDAEGWARLGEHPVAGMTSAAVAALSARGLTATPCPPSLEAFGAPPLAGHGVSSCRVPEDLHEHAHVWPR